MLRALNNVSYWQGTLWTAIEKQIKVTCQAAVRIGLQETIVVQHSCDNGAWLELEAR